MDTNTPRPTEIKLRQKSRLMELVFSDGSQFELSYELLRVYSPSAEVRGPGPGQPQARAERHPAAAAEAAPGSAAEAAAAHGGQDRTGRALSA